LTETPFKGPVAEKMARRRGGLPACRALRSAGPLFSPLATLPVPVARGRGDGKKQGISPDNPVDFRVSRHSHGGRRRRTGDPTKAPESFAGNHGVATAIAR